MWMFYNPIVKIQRIWRAVLEERIEEGNKVISTPEYIDEIKNN